MNNLQEIIVGVSVVAIVVSIWAIYYFIARIIYTLFDRWDDERMRKRIAYHNKRHSPIVTKSPSVKKSLYKSKSK